MDRFRKWASGSGGRLLLFFCLAISLGSTAFATGTGCANVSPATSSAPPAFTDIVLCVFDTIGVYSVLAALLAVIVPLLVIMWGMRSGVGLTSSLFRKAAGALGRH